MQKLYDEKLLPGQITNRPAPPPPDVEGLGQFYSFFLAKGNNPALVEFVELNMGENQLPKTHVALAHVNPGNWSYSDGYEQLNFMYTQIMDEDVKIREMVALKERVARLETTKRTSLLDTDSSTTLASLGGLGGAMLAAGGVAVVGWRRRDKATR